jgi:hypothetical protein
MVLGILMKRSHKGKSMIMPVKPSNLDNPDHAAFAWARYRRLMWWMALASTAAVGGGLYALHLIIGDIPLHMMIATAGGIFFSVLLAAALMGLVFLSSGTGHDDAIEDPFTEDE